MLSIARSAPRLTLPGPFRSRLRRRSGALATALVLGVSLTACADSQPPEASDLEAATAPVPASATESVDPAHNDADVTFAQDMIPHHERALQMADMALQTTQDPQVRTLAQGISDAQEPEITAMTGYLAWGAEPAPEGMGEEMGEGMTKETSMPGMMGDDELRDLDAAEGPVFDQMWLTGMIAHHEGAIEMAQVELAEGDNPQAKALAQKIADAQQGEILTMQGPAR